MEAHDHIWRPARYSICLWIGVLFDELLYVKVSAANTNHDLVTFLNLHINTLLAELIYAFRLPEEKYLEILSFRVFVKVFLQLHINSVLGVADVDAMALLQQLHFSASTF